MTNSDNDPWASWLAQETPEAVLEPDLPIIDPHHHLWWVPSRWGTYTLEDLWADTGSGHRVEQTLFIDARCSYREDGPEHLKPIGETEFIANVAEESAKATGKSRIGAIIGHAYMKLGAAVEEVLVGHLEAGRGLFRGIRSAFDLDDAKFNESFDVLAKLDLTFDNFSFDFTRLPDLASLADRYPGVTIIVNHLGGKVDPTAGAEEFANWRHGIDIVATCPNVVLKVGGAQQAAGPWKPPFHMDRRERPIGSEELWELMCAHYGYAIEAFGPERCMFESNFPVDKECVSYRTLWNTFKLIAGRMGLSEAEKTAIFGGTAARVYRVAPTD